MSANDHSQQKVAENNIQKAGNPIPKLSGIAQSAIIFLLVVAALSFGIFAGPLIRESLAALFMPQPAAQSEVAGAGEHQHGTPAAEKSASGWYVCTMHPWIVQPEPGICPICAMDLTPLDPDRFSAEVAIDPVVLQNIGVRVQPVVSGTVSRSLRTIGTVAYDETRYTDLNLKFDGWVETVHVNSVGAPVKKGEPLLEIYSPELVSSQEEYLLLWKNRNIPGNAELLAAARKRLSLFDITDAQVAALEQRGSAERTLTIHAPASGIVVDKMVNPGLRVMPGMTLFRIADLRQVWVIATVYEHQLPLVAVGRPVGISLSYMPGARFQGRISYIYPYLNEKTREAQVRIVLANPDGELKPGMYVDVEVGAPAAGALHTLAPREAVIDTGARKVAFVSLGEGKFEPRNVQTGLEADNGMIEVLDGLKPGELVVTSGQFLIDSEARIRESLAKMLKGNLASEQMNAPDMPSKHFTLPAVAQQQLGTALDSYLGVQQALYDGSLQRVAQPAKALGAAMTAMQTTAVPDQPHFWHENNQASTIAGHADKLAAAGTLDDARVQFGVIGEALDQLLKTAGLPAGYAMQVDGLRCGMFTKAPQGGIWLQVAGTARNPFFGSGSAMKSCNAASWKYPSAGNGDVAQPAPAVEPKKGESRPVAAVAQRASSADGSLDLLLEAYLQTQDELYRNSTARLQELGSLIDTALTRSGEAETSPARQNARTIANAQDLGVARAAFGSLSVAVRERVSHESLPASFAGKLVGKHCGMFANAPEGGIWLQYSGETHNPFFGEGSPMAACAPEEWPVKKAN